MRQDDIISAEIEYVPNQANNAARALQRLDFRVLHIGPTISVRGPQWLWASTFNVSFEFQERTLEVAGQGKEVAYPKVLIEDMHIPSELQNYVSGIMFMEPPEFY